MKDELSVESPIESPDGLVLDDKVILLWLIVFDQNPTRSYLCTSKKKVLASVEGAIRSTYGDVPDKVISPVIERIEQTWGSPFISLKCPPSLDLFVHRLEIDKYNPIGKILMECYDAVPYNSLREKIAELFVESAA